VAVKQVESAARVLGAFETLIRNQPIGLGALARQLGEPKSAVQRALATLAATGWITPAADEGSGWQASSRILVLAHIAQHGADIVEQARPVLERLQDETDETIILNVPDGDRVVVLDMAISRQLLRTSPQVGLLVPVPTSAAGRAILCHLPPDEAAAFLDGAPPADLAATLAADRARGWSINAGEVAAGASAVGAAVLAAGGRPTASITISVPTARMPAERYEQLGQLVAQAAAGLSDLGAAERGAP
jgi:IclR family acetate operon transcriptional repressor